MNEQKKAQETTDLNPPFNIDTKGNRPGFFERNETDVLMTALLETMSQLWVTKTRMENLERAILNNGVLSSEQIQAASRVEEDKAKRDAALQDFLSDAFRATSSNIQTVDERQREVDRFQSDETEQN